MCVFVWHRQTLYCSFCKFIKLANVNIQYYLYFIFFGHVKNTSTNTIFRSFDIATYLPMLLLRFFFPTL